MTALTIFLIAVSLSIDAFAVSVCGGMRLAEDRKFRGGLQYGAWFGIFQALMPFLGYHLGLYFAAWVDAYAHWIIFLILSWIGIGMIKEAHEEVSCKVITGPLTMLGLAVATSIDALGVGVGFAFEGLDIGPTVLEIGTITFCLSFMGCVFGSYIGMKGKAKAELMGGLVLVGLGIKSLLGHYFF